MKASNLTLPLDYDQLAAEYARHRQVHPGVLQALCQAAHEGHNVLEVGCGTGNYIRALHAQTGCTCWGIDPSAEMLARAKERAPTIRFSLGTAGRLDTPNDSLDLVYSVDVIHHVQDRLAYIQEAYRALTTGGQIYTATDSEWIIRHREPLSTYFPETVQAELARYPRIAHLCAFYHQAGFAQIDKLVVEFRTPLADIQAYRDRAYSSLHLIPEDAFQRGIAQMERDLGNGPIPYVSRYTLLWGSK
jgi:ubiquinone/menaquinone biosynthesis C-methylase UbiE